MSPMPTLICIKIRVVLYGDMNFLPTVKPAIRSIPTELDWILGIAVRWKDMELAFYREEDRPLDQSGLVQKYYAVQLRFALMCRRAHWNGWDETVGEHLATRRYGRELPARRF